MQRCIYCLEEFEKASKEHILQDSMGARWSSNRIVCNKDQDHFSRTIDLALANELNPIRNAFNIRSGRGANARILRNIQASDGRKYSLNPGFHLRQEQPRVNITESSDGQKIVEILLRDRTREQLGWALSKLRQEIPDFSANDKDLLATAKTVQLPPREISINLTFGGIDYFRGMLKACFNLFAVNYQEMPYKSCFDDVRNFIRSGTGNLSDFVRWVNTTDPLKTPKLGLLDQAIFIVSRGSSIEGVVQFFGEIIHSFQLTNSYEGNQIRCGYVVDPLRESVTAEIRKPEFVNEAIPIYASQSPICNSAVLNVFRERMSRILKLFYSRSKNE